MVTTEEGLKLLQELLDAEAARQKAVDDWNEVRDKDWMVQDGKVIHDPKHRPKLEAYEHANNRFQMTLLAVLGRTAKYKIGISDVPDILRRERELGAHAMQTAIRELPDATMATILALSPFEISRKT